MRDRSSHLRLSRLFYEADRGPRLAAQPENRPRRNLVAPVCPPYCSRVIEIRLCPDSAPAELSLSLYNETVPERSATLAESEAFRAEMIDSLDCVAFLDGEPACSGFVAMPSWQCEADIAHWILPWPPRYRRRGVGTALLVAYPSW